MARENAPRCIGRTIDKYEGGFDHDPRDRGNWTSGVIGKGELKGTKWGIAAFVYPNIDIKNLTREGAIAIYMHDYWPKVAADDLPVGVDMTVYDCCVNSGASRALKFLAGALSPPVQVSQVGLAKLAAYASASADKAALIKKANAQRRAFLVGLHNAVYEKGWLRRVADVEAISLQWWLESIKPAADVKKTLADEAGIADIQAKTNKSAAGASTAGSVATSGAVTQSTDLLMWVEIGLVGVLVFGVIWCGWHYYAQRYRAEAMRAAAATVGA